LRPSVCFPERGAEGQILALKGQGGYHLICDALNDKTVIELRKRKGRDQKPFAVLFRDLQAVREYCHLDDLEEETITSWRKPIVLLRQKKPLAESVNSGLKTIGAILPYMPFHHLIFREKAAEALILTSGNISENPVITDDAEALEQLGHVTDCFLQYNREIINRADDSVVWASDGKVSLIRRSRGFVPEPIDLDCDVDGILAFGAEQKNTFCIGKGTQAIMSQHIGDLKEPETCNFFLDTIHQFRKMFRFVPSKLVCDLHPDYLSSLFAGKMAEELHLPLIRVQHHYAHIASCMAEHHLDEEVIGVSLDGTGMGADGHIWGGEFLVADRNSFQRYAHFDYIPMPGGDKAVKEPWRMALSYLHHYPETRKLISKVPVFKSFEKQTLYKITEMVEKEINSPLTSGAGRLFDAVAVLLGLCTEATFDAEPPMRLESLLSEGIQGNYPYISGTIISFAPMLESIVMELIKGNDIAGISAKFHNTIAEVITDISSRIRNDQGIRKVVLSGGVFQNRYLLLKSISRLEALNFKVYINQSVPANDGGIALGQLIIASKKNLPCV
jgi:hydrogenase maturation protein HypF